MTDAHAAQPTISRVLMADDRVRTRRALFAVLAVHPWIQVLGEASHGEDAVAEVDRLRPDSSAAALAAGADAFVPKGAPVQDLFQALVGTADRP